MRISDWSSDVCSSYLEIDVEDNIPVGVGQRLEGLVLLAGDAARIVHEDIYAARLAGDRLDPACRCHAVAKIDRRAADIHGDERLKTCGIKVASIHPRALPTKTLGDRPAQGQTREAWRRERGGREG